MSNKYIKYAVSVAHFCYRTVKMDKELSDRNVSVHEFIPKVALARISCLKLPVLLSISAQTVNQKLGQVKSICNFARPMLQRKRRGLSERFIITAHIIEYYLE